MSCLNENSREISKRYHSLFKVINKVKVSNEKVKFQGQGHRVKHVGTHGKVLSQSILILNIKTLAITIQKLLARLLKNRSNSKIKVTG